jgi:hypothetical protein
MADACYRAAGADRATGGTLRPSMIDRLVARDTVEERLLALEAKKPIARD